MAACPPPSWKPRPHPSARRRRLVLIPVALLGLIGLALAYLFLTAQPEPSVPLGASASIPGGMASIGEIVPVEDDGWEPEDNDDALDGAPAEGSHRVRLLVRITALEPGGLRLDTGDFSISGLGRERFRPLWQSPPVVDLTQGDDCRRHPDLRSPGQGHRPGPGRPRRLPLVAGPVPPHPLAAGHVLRFFQVPPPTLSEELPMLKGSWSTCPLHGGKHSSSAESEWSGRAS